MGYNIITVNREFESLGNEIAQAVAAKLSLPYYDKFLITASAEESGVEEHLVAATDEKLASRFEYSQAEAAYYYAGKEDALPTGAKVAEVQFNLIRRLAAEGPCLFVGRCANHVLRERGDVLDIFVHAGENSRLQRAMTALGLPEKKALRVLRRTDKARAGYYKHYTDADWHDPNQYHACLNTDLLSFDACVSAICGMYNS